MDQRKVDFINQEQRENAPPPPPPPLRLLIYQPKGGGEKENSPDHSNGSAASQVAAYLKPRLQNESGSCHVAIRCVSCRRLLWESSPPPPKKKMHGNKTKGTNVLVFFCRVVYSSSCLYANPPTALSAASGRGRMEVCVYLLEQGPDLELANRRGMVPLLSAAKHGHTQV